MQAKRVTVLLQGVAACALLIWGVPVIRAASPSPTGQENQTDIGTKPKKTKKSAADTAAPAASPAETTQNTVRTPGPVKNASEAEIAAAKSSGKVWVNTGTGVYHKGGKWFGATKQGKFMNEDEAVKAGYRPAKNEK
jgi:hypothetical protein